jgi:Protein of unknown function (DUF1439)
MTVRRRSVLWAVAAAAASGLIGCASLFRPTAVTLSARDIERLLERRFPLERRLLEVFDLTLDRPRLTLQPERNRVAVVLDFDARERLWGTRSQGRLDFDAALRWQASDRSLRLWQVRVQDLSLDRAGSAQRGGAERLGGALIERVLEDLPVYTLSDERAEQLRREGLAPGGVTVTARGVEVTLEAAAR